jgi:hypothetical protein
MPLTSGEDGTKGIVPQTSQPLTPRYFSSGIMLRGKKNSTPVCSRVGPPSQCGQVSPAALHQQTQPGLHKTCPRRAGRRTYRGLPRGSAGTDLATSAGGGQGCCPRGIAWSGDARTPHGSQRARTVNASVILDSADPTQNPAGREGTEARTSNPRATSRAKYVPDAAVTHGVQRGATGTPIVTPERTPRPVIAGQRLFLLVWRVKDSNLGRHQPTDLQPVGEALS